MSLAKYMADSANCVRAWGFYAISSMYDGTDSTTMLYNLVKNYALGTDYNVININKMLPLKPKLSLYLNEEIPLQPVIHPDSIRNHRLMYLFNRTYGRLIVHNKDTVDYQAYRYLVHKKDLFPIAKFIADSTSYMPAYLDVYRCYLKIDGYPIMMSSERFAEANNYLEYAVNHDYLPAIWFKSLLLLTGTYLPQDTIEGKRLLDMCIESSPSTIPFWRK